VESNETLGSIIFPGLTQPGEASAWELLWPSFAAFIVWGSDAAQQHFLATEDMCCCDWL
jgi:hypothetical protein